MNYQELKDKWEEQLRYIDANLSVWSDDEYRRQQKKANRLHTRMIWEQSIEFILYRWAR